MVKKHYFCKAMKCKILVLLLLSVFPMGLSASGNSALLPLNNALGKRSVYQKQHLSMIAELKRRRTQCRTPEQSVDANDKLMEAYKDFCSDSAFIYISYNQ